MTAMRLEFSMEQTTRAVHVFLCSRWIYDLCLEFERFISILAHQSFSYDDETISFDLSTFNISAVFDSLQRTTLKKTRV